MLKFSCFCHPLYPFLMTFLDHLHSPFTTSPGVKTLRQYGGQCNHILWHCLVSKRAAGFRQSSYSLFLLHLHRKHLHIYFFLFQNGSVLSISHTKCRDNVRKRKNCNHSRRCDYVTEKQLSRAQLYLKIDISGTEDLWSATKTFQKQSLKTTKKHLK